MITGEITSRLTHTLMAACFSRVILVVSYIGLYLSWVSPRVLHLWPNYPPDIPKDYSRTVDREGSKKRARCFPLPPDTPLSVDVTVDTELLTSVSPFSASGPTTDVF